tara:strand:- start:234 stop:395 length:162 start_codon:yes stop_codon:yes gene_type:complete
MKPRNRLVVINEEEYVKLLHDIDRLTNVSSFTFAASILNTAMIFVLFITMLVN